MKKQLVLGGGLKNKSYFNKFCAEFPQSQLLILDAKNAAFPSRMGRVSFTGEFHPLLLKNRSRNDLLAPADF